MYEVTCGKVVWDTTTPHLVSQSKKESIQTSTIPMDGILDNIVISTEGSQTVANTHLRIS